MSTAIISLPIAAGTAQDGAVAIIRLSGAKALTVAASIFQSVHAQQPSWGPQSHRVYHGHACGPSGNVIDEVGLYLPAQAARRLLKRYV